MRSTRVFAAGLLTAATLAGPALAMLTDPPHQPALAPVVKTATPSDDTSSGFDWSSAGIGAAGGVGAFAIALAGAAGLRRRSATPPCATDRHPLSQAPDTTPPGVGHARRKGDSA